MRHHVDAFALFKGSAHRRPVLEDVFRLVANSSHRSASTSAASRAFATSTCSPLLTPPLKRSWPSCNSSPCKLNGAKGLSRRNFSTSLYPSAAQSLVASRLASRVSSPKGSQVLAALQATRLYSSASEPRRAIAAPTASILEQAAADADANSRSATDASAKSNANSSSSDATLTKPLVAWHLFALAFLVYSIVIVGGLTRLTESGLSITEWNPGFKGMWYPTTEEGWIQEWDKYRETPEFKLLNHGMTLDDFKTIYLWEWGHRILGRVIGVTFILPAAFFLTRGWVARSTRWKLMAIAGGIGFQGFLGWFMVKSGLTPPPGSAPQINTDPHTTTALASSSADWTPRVSQFRLAMHLGAAFLLYCGMLHTGLSIMRDYKLATQSGTLGGWTFTPQNAAAQAQKYVDALSHPLVRRHARTAAAVTLLSFVTILSGAMVAGLDAGLVYNEFPTMGDGRIAPPAAELMDDRYAQKQDKSDKVWRNLTSNPVTVQLIHRTLAITTLFSVLALGWKTRSLSKALPKATGNTLRLPPTIPRLAAVASAFAVGQATLGITTLIYLVPIPLASAHQAGSLAVLSMLIALLAAMKKPSQAIALWRQHQANAAARGARGAASKVAVAA